MRRTSNIENINETIGTSAGKVWHALSEGNKMNLSELESKTELKNNLICSAIGWLARENKIYRDGELYALGETNLTSEIGTNAGKVWGALNERGVLSMQSLRKHTELDLPEIYFAVGWLARENKIVRTGNRYELKK